MIDPVLLDFPDRIESARLLLRCPVAGDGAQLHAAVADSLPQLRAFLAALPWVAAEPSVAASEAFCRNAHSNFVARKDLTFLAFEKGSDRLIGAVGLHRIVWQTPKFEIGYWGRTGCGRQGYISEAVSALADFALTRLHAARIEIVTDESNQRSRRVAERCGFALECVRRHESRAPDGSLRDTCIYIRLGAPRR